MTTVRKFHSKANPAAFGLLIALLLLIAAVYWPGLTGGFAFDDYPNLVLNTSLHVVRLDWSEWIAATLSSGSSDLQRPLAMFTFAINHYFTGLNPWPMKLTNLCIHLVNAGLVFVLTRSLLRAINISTSGNSPDTIALFVAACWALMPINLMAVLLIVQRMESLSQSFVLVGLWLYVSGRLRIREGYPGWKLIIVGVVFGTGLGALSKESAVLLPLYAFCAELFIFGFRKRDETPDRRLMGLYLVILLVPAIVGLAWLLPHALNPDAYAQRNFNLSERLLTESRVVLDYLHWTLAPDLNQLSLFHDDYPVSRGVWTPPITVLGLIALPALAVAAWLIRFKRPLSSLGLAWFLSAHVLTATFIPLELVFEHRNYFASFGICLVLADLLLIAPTSITLRRAGQGFSCFLLIFYAGSTHVRALEWSNPLRFAITEAAKHPQSPRATYQLAQAYAILSEGKLSSPFTQAAFEAFERANLVPDASISALQGSLLLAARTGSPSKAEWWQEMQARLREESIGPQELGALGALTDCAIAGRCHFPPEEMLGTFSAALSHGDNPEVLSIYGNYALNILRDPPLTERLWRESAKLRPGEPQYAISLAKLMIAQGRTSDARREIRRLRTIGRFGQYKRTADALESRLVDAIRNGAGTPSTPELEARAGRGVEPNPE